ncbi:MAG: ribonuclease P component 1 family protein [Candidatus Natronoplasma sp.]
MSAKRDVNTVYAYEFIGSHIEIEDSDHEGYIGVAGKVLDETKNTFVIGDEKERTIPKQGNRFRIKFDDHWKTLDGSLLTYRPEDRIKKLG